MQVAAAVPTEILCCLLLSGSQLECLKRLAHAMLNSVTPNSGFANAAACAQFVTALIHLEHRALQPHLEARL